jgi:phosphonate transport system substrate-binding protein
LIQKKLTRVVYHALILTAIALALALTGCTGKTGTGPQEKKTVRVGFMICNGRDETEARFRPLCEYLSRKLGMNFVPVTIDTIEFEQAVRDKKVDFTHTNSLLYIMLNKDYGVEILAGDVNGKYGSRSRGAIIVKKDSPIKKISDLKGKRMVFGPMLAPTGYLSQYYLMLKNGFNPETDLAFYSIPQGSYKHEKVIYSLLMGNFDAAAAPMLDFEQMTASGKINPDDFRVVAEAETIPYCSFGVCENVDEGLAKKVKEALLALKADDTVEYGGERLKVLKAAMVEGFTDVKDSDYDIVREMAKTCNMPPYQKF